MDIKISFDIDSSILDVAKLQDYSLHLCSIVVSFNNTGRNNLRVLLYKLRAKERSGDSLICSPNESTNNKLRRKLFDLHDGFQY